MKMPPERMQKSKAVISSLTSVFKLEGFYITNQIKDLISPSTAPRHLGEVTFIL